MIELKLFSPNHLGKKLLIYNFVPLELLSSLRSSVILLGCTFCHVLQLSTSSTLLRRRERERTYVYRIMTME